MHMLQSDWLTDGTLSAILVRHKSFHDSYWSSAHSAQTDSTHP